MTQDKIRANVTTVLMLLLAVGAGAWIGTTFSNTVKTNSQPTQKPSTITVTGKSDQLVTPDLAIVSFTMTTNGESVTQTQQEDKSKIQAITQAFSTEGIYSTDIQTQWYNLAPRFDGSGFQINRTFRVTIRDLIKVDKIVNTAVSSGVTRVEGINYLISNQLQAQSQSYEAAIKDARERADKIAQKLGVHINSIQSVTSGNTSGLLGSADSLAGGTDSGQLNQHMVPTVLTVVFAVD